MYIFLRKKYFKKQPLPSCLRVLLRLFFKVLFIQKSIKIIFFLFLKKLFLISVHKNDIKIPKKILI